MHARNSRQSSAFVPTMMSTSARAPARSLDRLCREHVAVDDRLERHQVATTSAPQRSGSGSRISSAFSAACAAQQPSDGTAAIASSVGPPRACAPAPWMRHAGGAGRTWCAAPLSRIARRKRPRRRHREQRADAHRARRLAADGDVVGIAPESGDVVADPLERRDLVEQAAVRRRIGEEEEPLGAAGS